jgi:UDP-glucose 4-epimerase
VTTRVLVTGASGLLGRALVRVLAKGPDLQVTAVSRRGGEVGGLRIDALDLESCGSAARVLDVSYAAIFHLAALIPDPRRTDSEDLLAANVAMTATVLEAARRSRAHVIYASSAYIYAPNPERRLDEDAPIAPPSRYHQSKYEGERLLAAASAEGVHAASLRIAAPYGAPSVRPNVIQTFVHRARHSEDLLIHGTGRRSQDFVHVDDVVAGMVGAFDSRARGVFNIASGTSTSMWDLAHLIRAAVPGTRSEVRLSGKADAQEDIRWAFDTDRAHRAFGYAPSVHLADGLRRLAGAV